MANISISRSSLAEEEDDELNFHVDEGLQIEFDVNFYLVGKFLTHRPIRVAVMKERMAGVWSPVKGVLVKEANLGIFLFQFFHPKDIDCALKKGCGRLITICWFLDECKWAPPCSTFHYNMSTFGLKFTISQLASCLKRWRSILHLVLVNWGSMII